MGQPSFGPDRRGTATHKQVTAAAPSDVRRIASRLRLGQDGLQRALELTGVPPSPAAWVRGLDRFLLVFGCAAILAGVAAFFAWNWDGLHRLAKFAVIEAAIVLGVALAAWRGIDSPAGRGGLFAAAFLVGTLLAVYGQAYQTGADPWGLFMTWGLLIVLWVAVGRQQAMWFLLLVLANLALILLWTQVYRPTFVSLVGSILGPFTGLLGAVTDSALAMLVFALNAGCLAAWEWCARAGVTWMTGRWFPRLAAVIALGVTVAGSMMFVFDFHFDDAGAWAIVSGPSAFVAFTILSLWYYQFRQHDLFMLTLTVLCVIAVVTAVVGRALSGGGVEIALLLALLVIGQTAGAAIWLRGVSRRWARA